MPFTAGNDINLLQATDIRTVGAGAGNDAYILSAALLAPNQQITISDSQGTNTLRLVAGLEIVGSAVSSSAVQLTLNNGAVVTLLGANSFQFQTGGDAITGAGGAKENFSSFVTQSLGYAAVPAAGAKAVSSNAMVSVLAAGGTTVEPGQPTQPTEPTEPTQPTEPTGLLDLAQARERVEPGVGALATTASPYVNALLSEDAWTKQALTYSMEAVMPTEYAQDVALSDGWKPLTTTEKDVVRDAFTSFNALLDLSFTEVGSGGDIRLSAVRTDANVSGFAYPPFGANALAGDVFLDVNGRTTLDYYDNGNYGRSVVVHELGHALGLKHPHEGPIMLPTQLDNLAHTVMTYEHSQYVTYHFTYSNGVYESSSEDRYPDQFSLLDIHALQGLYGANTSTRTGNQTYTYADIDRTGYLTLWDAGGQDTLDVSGAPGRSVIDLRGGNYSSVGLHTTQELVQAAVDKLVAQGGTYSTAFNWVNGFLTRADVEPTLYTGANNLAIVQGVWLENLYTGAGNDVVYDNGVNNRIFTADGNDTIYLSAGGFDYVDAGAGLDTVAMDILSTQVQRETQPDGSLLLVSDSFAAQLVGVEQLQFSDMTWSA